MAPEPLVEEDDWEWTIAIARARAAAEEADLALADAVRPSRRRGDTVPPPATRPVATTPARPLPAAASARDPQRDTQPLSDFDLSDHTKPTVIRRVTNLHTVPTHAVPTLAKKPAFVNPTTVVETPTPSLAKTTPFERTAPIARVATPTGTRTPPPLGIPTPPQPLPIVTPPIAQPTPLRTYARGASPVTVIPIPKLPRVDPSRLAPVVPIPPTQPRRFAKGTGPITPSTASAHRTVGVGVGDDTTPSLSVGDKTVPSMALPRGA